MAGRNAEGFSMKRTGALLAALIGLVGAITYASLSNIDAHQADQDFAFYCKMVEIWEDTNGEHGWPDYRELKGECND